MMTTAIEPNKASTSTSHQKLNRAILSGPVHGHTAGSARHSPLLICSTISSTSLA